MLSAAEARKILNLSKKGLNNLIHQKKLKAVKIGNYWAIDEKSLKKYQETHPIKGSWRDKK